MPSTRKRYSRVRKAKKCKSTMYGGELFKLSPGQVGGTQMPINLVGGGQDEPFRAHGGQSAGGKTKLRKRMHMRSRTKKMKGGCSGLLATALLPFSILGMQQLFSRGKKTPYTGKRSSRRQNGGVGLISVL
jgi:hypothetical protein